MNYQLDCLEVSKPVREADRVSKKAIDFCRYYKMEQLDQRYSTILLVKQIAAHYQPRCIAVVISPGIFPLAIATGMTVAALVTGQLHFAS